MQQPLNEQVSEIMDGIESTDGLDQLIAESKEQELRTTWLNYHIIGDVIRGEKICITNTAFANRIHKRLLSESQYPETQVVRAENPSRYLREKKHLFHNLSTSWQWLIPATGGAITATIAVMTLGWLNQSPLYLNTPQPNDQPPASSVAFHETVAQQPSSTPAPALVNLVDEGIRWNLDHPEIALRLDEYLVNHREYVGSVGVSGLMPYASFVGYDRGQ